MYGHTMQDRVCVCVCERERERERESEIFNKKTDIVSKDILLVLKCIWFGTTALKQSCQ